MSKRNFYGKSGQSEFGAILERTANAASSTCNSTLGHFQDVFVEGGKFFTAIVPNALNGGGDNFYGTIQEISKEEADRLRYS